MVNSRDPQALEAVANSFDFTLSTVNADLPWGFTSMRCAPRGGCISSASCKVNEASPTSNPARPAPAATGRPGCSASPGGAGRSSATRAIASWRTATALEAAADSARARGQASLGTVVFGGLAVATVLSLFVVPMFYVVIKQLTGARPPELAPIDESPTP